MKNSKNNPKDTKNEELLDEKSSGGVAAVDRAFQILQSFRESDSSLSLSDIADRTGFYKSTILRLLQSLERFSYIVKGTDGRYRVGHAAWRLGMLFKRELRIEERLMPFLKELSEKTNETVALWIPLANTNPPTRICFLRVESPFSVGTNFRVGDTLPLKVSDDKLLGATGRLIRAFVFPDYPQDESIRNAYVYSSYGVRDSEILGIAAPIFDSDNNFVGALNLSAPTSRRDQEWMKTMENLLLLTASQATAALGGKDFSTRKKGFS